VQNRHRQGREEKRFSLFILVCSGEFLIAMSGKREKSFSSQNENCRTKLKDTQNNKNNVLCSARFKVL
jgi:hypothetical protein